MKLNKNVFIAVKLDIFQISKNLYAKNVKLNLMLDV